MKAWQITELLGKQEGYLAYWYHTPKEGGERAQLQGIADLSWRCTYSSAKVNKMEGHYSALKDKGRLTYIRITEEEYEAHRRSRLL